MKNLKLLIISLVFILGSTLVNAQSVEEIIKGRKAMFSENYQNAKKISILLRSGKKEEAKPLMKKISDNYKKLLDYFPENTKEGFKTESLPIIWEEKENFNNLMTKASTDMAELTKIIEGSDDIRGSLGKLMWSNCKACHSKYRKEH